MQIHHTQTLISSPKPFSLIPFSVKKTPKFNVAALGSRVLKANHSLRTKNRNVICSAADRSIDNDAKRKRKVVEHVCLLKGKEDLSEEQEKDMLDYLYTTQYQMGGIVSISLGRVSGGNDDKYSHAIYMRFQRREDLLKFYENKFFLDVLRDHVVPYCHEIINVDFESEVEDDMLSIFRKGEEFNYGVELVFLVAFGKSYLDGPAEDALLTLSKLTMDFPSLIVQATIGSNVNISSTEYTHGVVIRFRSTEAFQMFMNSSEYKNMPYYIAVECLFQNQQLLEDLVGKQNESTDSDILQKISFSENVGQFSQDRENVDLLIASYQDCHPSRSSPRNTSK